MRRRILVLAGSAFLLATAASPAVGAEPMADASIGAEPAHSGVDHVIVIIEQNHTFDSYFGSYPGAEGLSGEATVADRSIDRGEVDGENRGRLTNGRLAALDALGAGTAEGFVDAQDRRGFDGALALQTKDRDSASILWELADQYTLFDNYYSSAHGGSLANTLYLMTGDDHGVSADNKEALATVRDLDAPTVFDRLADVGESWKLYVGRLDEIDPDSVVDGRYEQDDETTPSALYWAPALAMPRFWTDPELRSGLADQEAFYRDNARGELPAVSFVIPQPTDHPAGAGDQGPVRLQSLLNSVIKSPDWDRTAVFVVWDDWGGFRDHVMPPTGLGFRVPMLLVSPHARQGHVSSTELDHTSVLDFIVDQYGLEPLSNRQAASNGFEDALLDTPRVDRQLVTDIVLDPTPVGTQSQNRMTLLLYLGAMAIGLAWLARLWRRPRPLITGALR